MIKTQAYNNFSSFSYEQRKDSNFILQQLKKLTQNGGDPTLMVCLDDYGDNLELITFRDFIIKYIPQPSLFFQLLMKDGIIPRICDFKFDLQTGSITDNKDYGLNWMSLNYQEYSDIIKQSITNLLETLPEDISKITTLNKYDYYGKTESLTHNEHPLLQITKQLEQVEIYDMILKSKPQFKLEFLKPNKRDKNPIFIDIIKSQYNQIRKPDLGILFYKYGICNDYIHQTENKEQLKQLISHAVFLEDYDFLNKILPLCNLQQMEKNDQYELILFQAKTEKMVNLLLDYNAVIEQKENGNTSDVNIFLSDSFNSVEAFDAILKRLPKYRENIKTNSNNTYNLMKMKNFDFSKLLIEKYEFPLENYDMLSIAFEQDGDYSWLVKHGADTRECETFCSKIINAREEGLKKLRVLNKEGIIVAKSPDFIFNIFNNLPTKNFINYYDKITHIELEKTTKKGYPAWWGAKTLIDYKFMYSRISHPEQKAIDGKSYLWYALERELQTISKNKLTAKESIQFQIDSMKKKSPLEKLDLSYVDKNGNNFLHLFVTLKEYRKDILDNNIMDILKENSSEKPYSYLMKPNKEGITPIEILINQKIKPNWSIILFIKKAIEEEAIDFTKTLSTNEKVGTKILEYIKDDKNLFLQLQNQILQTELLINSENKIKKIKI